MAEIITTLGGYIDIMPQTENLPLKKKKKQLIKYFHTLKTVSNLFVKFYIQK